MKTVRYFEPGDRYKWDAEVCTESQGYAQVDTKQDCWCVGTWCNPFSGVILSYTEGDVCIQTAGSNSEFIRGIRELADWNRKMEYWSGIDPGWGPFIELKLLQLGLGDLLHYEIKEWIYDRQN